LVLGWFLFLSVGVIIAAPVATQITVATDFDPFHFGMFGLIAAIYVGSAATPVDTALFTTIQVIKLPMEEMVLDVLPLLCISMFTIVLITFFPSISRISRRSLSEYPWAPWVLAFR